MAEVAVVDEMEGSSPSAVMKFFPAERSKLAVSNAMLTKGKVSGENVKLVPQASVPMSYMKRFQEHQLNTNILSSSPIVDVRKTLSNKTIGGAATSMHDPPAKRSAQRSNSVDNANPATATLGKIPSITHTKRQEILPQSAPAKGEDQTKTWAQKFLTFNDFEMYVAMETLRKYLDEDKRAMIAELFINDLVDGNSDASEETEIVTNKTHLLGDSSKSGTSHTPLPFPFDSGQLWDVDDVKDSYGRHDRQEQRAKKKKENWGILGDDYEEKDLPRRAELDSNTSSNLDVRDAYEIQFNRQMSYKPRHTVNEPLGKDAGVLECTAHWDTEHKRLELYLESDHSTPILSGQLMHNDVDEMLNFEVKLADVHGGDRLCMLNQVRMIPLAQFEVNTESFGQLNQRPYVSKGAAGGLYASLEGNMEEYDSVKRQLAAIQIKCDEETPRQVLSILPAICLETGRPHSFYPQYENNKILALAAAGAQKNLVYMSSKEPEYDAQLKGFCLDFGDRITVPSSKNFVLTKHGKKKNLFRFGKYGPNKYALSLSYPFSVTQGFCTALANIAVSLQIFLVDRELSEYNDDSDSGGSELNEDTLLHDNDYYFSDDG